MARVPTLQYPTKEKDATGKPVVRKPFGAEDTPIPASKSGATVDVGATTAGDADELSYDAERIPTSRDCGPTVTDYPTCAAAIPYRRATRHSTPR